MKTTEVDAKKPNDQDFLSDEELGVFLDWLQARASRCLRGYRGNFTLDTVALVNEAVLKILRNNLLDPATTPAYLYGAAGRAVREALADAVRKKKRLKNGAEFAEINLFDQVDPRPSRHADFLDLHTAVEALKANDEPAAQVVDLKFFAGWTIKKIAEQLDVSDFTVEERWRKARRFLKRFLSEKD